MSGSRTIIAAEDRLDNVHPGDVLREDFLVGSEVPVEDVTTATGLSRDRLTAIVAGAVAIDADADLRLSRYFDVSEGFFLRLQNAYDLRRHGGRMARS